MTRSALLEEASRLEVAERIELVEAIWESLSADLHSQPVPTAHREELDRRLADFDAHPDTGSSWDEVRARLERRGR